MGGGGTSFYNKDIKWGKMKMNRKGDIQQCSLGWGTHKQNLLGLDNYKSTNRYPATLAMDSRCILARIRVN